MLELFCFRQVSASTDELTNGTDAAAFVTSVYLKRGAIGGAADHDDSLELTNEQHTGLFFIIDRCVLGAGTSSGMWSFQLRLRVVKLPSSGTI